MIHSVKEYYCNSQRHHIKKRQSDRKKTMLLRAKANAKVFIDVFDIFITLGVFVFSLRSVYAQAFPGHCKVEIE